MADPTGTPVAAIWAGDIVPLTGYESKGLDGRGQIVKGADGAGDRIDLQITGLSPMVAYTGHVHAQPCAYGGGGHYKLDPAILDTVETNEVWIRFTTDAAGIGQASLTTAAPLRGDAISFVVHDPEAGVTPAPKMACVDLTPPLPEAVIASGTFAPFAAAEAIDQTIAGMANLERSPGGTTVTVNITGLNINESYGAHVHALPCAVTTGGGHYKINPTIVDPLETNELWPAVGNQPDGVADSSVSVAVHVARTDAQSIVVHRLLPAGGTPPKVACADLIPARQFNLETFGTAVLTTDGETRMANLFATGTMQRELSGITRAIVAVQHATAGMELKVHVHTLPCADGGGGHYKIDTSITDAMESNEMWMGMTVGTDGSAYDYVASGHIARADARSIVIHDAADGAKLACIDLQ